MAEGHALAATAEDSNSGPVEPGQLTERCHAEIHLIPLGD
jgi:hypothetical protein